jgi:hypothetical protein
MAVQLTPLFIPSIPKDAQYIEQESLRPLLEQEEFNEAIQFLDPRTQLPQDYSTHLFEIKDKQLSKHQKPARVGISIFRMKVGTHQPFSDYLNGLKELISYFSDQTDSILTVFVGDDIWDLLHQEGCLRAKHVDFIRILDSSSYSRIGQCWRYLVYGDMSESFATIIDTDLMQNLRDGNACHLLPIYIPDLKSYQTRWEKIDKSYHFICRIPIWEESTFYPVGNFHAIRDLPLFITNHPPGFWSSPYKTPVDVAKVFAQCLFLRPYYTLYYPNWNVFTFFPKGKQQYTLSSLQHTWHFYMPLKCAIRVREKAQSQLVTNRIGLRFLKQCYDEGNSVFYYDHDGPRSVFNNRGEIMTHEEEF